MKFNNLLLKLYKYNMIEANLVRNLVVVLTNIKMNESTSIYIIIYNPIGQQNNIF